MRASALAGLTVTVGLLFASGAASNCLAQTNTPTGPTDVTQAEPITAENDDEGEKAAEKEDADSPRDGAVFSLALGGHYAFFTDHGFSAHHGFDDDESHFGPSLGFQVGGHAGFERAAILADFQASLWPETDHHETAFLFSVGPAFRISPVSRLIVEGGISFALTARFADPWCGPAGHVGLGVELTNGRSRFALELQTRFDLAYLYPYNCDGDCGNVTLGRVTTQLAVTSH